MCGHQCFISYYSRHGSRFTLGIDPPLQPTFEFLQVKSQKEIVTKLRDIGKIQISGNTASTYQIT